MAAAAVAADPLRAEITLPDALETPAWEWTTSLEAPFVGRLAANAMVDGDLAECLLLPDRQFIFESPAEGWMETVVEGPGVFRIFMRGSGDPYLSAGLRVDGVDVDQWRLDYDFGPTPQEWRAYSGAIHPGPHTVRVWGCFACEDEGTLPVVAPAMQADHAALLPLDPGLAEAMDTPGQLWYAGGLVSVAVDGDAHDGIDAVRSEVTEGVSWIETLVEGPATVSWWRKGRAAIWIDDLAVYGDLDLDWTRDVYFVPPGEKVLRWSDDDAGPSGQRSTLDQFVSVPSPETTLAEALDDPARLFTQGGGGLWRGAVTEAAPEGIDLAWLEVRPGDPPTWLETVVEGPASLEYELVVRGDVSPAVTDNGEPIDLGYGYVFAERSDPHRSLLPPGTHRIRWEATQSSYPFSSKGILMLDQLVVTPLLEVSLQDAMDDPALTWTTSGDHRWTGLASTLAPDGVDAVLSPALMEGESAWLETNVTGPGTFSFQWSPGLEPQSVRKWEFLVDGDSLSWAVGSSRNTANSRFVELGPGAHSLRWQLRGAVAGSVLVLDRAEWTPAPLRSLSPALDLPPSNLHWQNLAWTPVVDDTHDGIDALQFGPVGTFTNLSQLSLRVRGPALVSFYAKTGPQCTLQYRTDGVPSTVARTDGAWVLVTMQIPPGDREIHLTPLGNVTAPTLANSVWIDEFTITPNGLPLATVLDPTAPGLEWITNPANPWSGIDRPGLSNVVAAGRSANGELSWLETRVDGPAVIKLMAMGQGRQTYPYVPGLRFLLDGKESAAIYSSTPQWMTIYIPPGPHTLHIEAAPEPQQVNPEIQRFSVAPMNGEPTVRLVDGHFEFTIPRPAGFTDDKIGINVSRNLAGIREPIAGRVQFTVHQSTPDQVVLRFDVATFGFPESLFGAARFDP